jgi:anhydro-N-acetylmuramic acid kinase
MPQRWLIGLTSGSSAAGADAALVEVRGVGLNLRATPVRALHQPYSPELRDLVRKACGPSPVEVRHVALAHRLLGETFAAAAQAVADRSSLSLSQVQCVGLAGHTAWMEAEGRFPSALGLGMAAVVAERCGVTVVSDLRARDLAAGGQGVPLAALPDFLLFRNPREGRLLLHLGGMARVVFLPAGGRLPEVVGFEAAPCNLLLDALMRHLTGGRETYDTGGKHAVQGRCLEPLLTQWLAHPALQRRPPRGLPRFPCDDDFAAGAVQQARQLGGSLHDLLCTATHLVAQAVMAALAHSLPADKPVDRVLVSGGGARNGLLWRLIEQGLDGVPMDRTDAAGVAAVSRKALSAALLAALTLDGVPASVPSATGAAGSRLLGSLTPGEPGNWARCLAWMASHTAPPALGGEDE